MQGHWNNIPGKTGFFNLCYSQDPGDEFHHLLKCSFMPDIRKNYINIKIWS
jgi:hypothetical protein